MAIFPNKVTFIGSRNLDMLYIFWGITIQPTTEPDQNKLKTQNHTGWVAVLQDTQIEMPALPDPRKGEV